MGYLRCFLQCFEVVFGLKVNLVKSVIFSVGHVHNVSSLTLILG